ncbi:MAG: serine/threonine protein kinase [Acidobacteria bacterium]|nr:serine/threonine protein kinase [Acidobacteriota bacterium]
MMDLTMDIDDLKLAWQSLDRRLERQNELAFQRFKDDRVRRARWRLWPLYGGQVAQGLIGAALVVAAVTVWVRHWDLVHLRVAGLLMHAYGIGVIAVSGRTLWFITRIDYAAPVVAIQRQLGELRQWYALSGLLIGLAWWLLWMPFMMVAVGLLGVDMWRRAPDVFVLGTIIGVAGLLLTWGLYRVSRRPRWAWLAAQMDESMAGASLRRAQAVLDEVRRFEDDGEPRPTSSALAPED